MDGRYDLGFLGGGQLARMSIQAAQAMGLRCLSLDPVEITPASQIADAIVGRLDSVERISELFRACDRLTLENEFIPAAAIRRAADLAGESISKLVPGVESLEVIQDKLAQRTALSRASIPSPRAVAIEGQAESAIAEIGFPMVLKARFGGYDGKGTRYAKTEPEFRALASDWSGGGWLAEEFVPFTRELAAMVYVDESGEGSFPTMESKQTDHVCDWVRPCEADGAAVAVAAVRSVGGFGLFGVELFELADGQILVNEIAPRPHNSGHYTLDWGGVSQFEQHVRLAVGLPPMPAAGHPTTMVNLLGQAGSRNFRSGAMAALRAVPEVRFHWYGKAETRVGRKMGHLNLRGNDLSGALNARERFYEGWTA